LGLGNVPSGADIPIPVVYCYGMAPRANWDKLIPSFNYALWSLSGLRHEIGANYLPVMVSFYENKTTQLVPADVINELVNLKIKTTEGLITDKFSALQTHIKIADPANCLRLANELLMIKPNQEPIAEFIAEFMRDLLAKKG